MENVFVYGTLMKGYWNDRYLSGQKFIGRARLGDYQMYQVASFPGIVKKKDAFILGEVYEIDDRVLKSLDRLEGEGHMYQRVKEKVAIGEQELDAYVYVWLGDVEGGRKVTKMPWKPAKVRCVQW